MEEEGGTGGDEKGGWRGLSGEVSRREECGDGGVKGIRDGIYGIGI